MNLLDRLTICQADTLNNEENKMYKRGAMIFNEKLNKPLYVEISTSPEGYPFIEGKNYKNLSINIYNTNLDKSLNGIEGVEGVTFIDSVYSPEKVELSKTPIANVSGSIWAGGAPSIDKIRVKDDYIRNGIGKMCMRLAEEIFAQAGYPEIYASRFLTKGACYLPTKLKTKGRFGELISKVKYKDAHRSNHHAGKEFLESCGYKIDNHYMAQHGSKLIVQENTEIEDYIPAFPDALWSVATPAEIRKDLRDVIVYPSNNDGVACNGNMLSKAIANINDPSGVSKFQVDGITLSIENIKELSMKKSSKTNEMV